MKIQIKRIDKSLPLPKYETLGSVGFDLFSRKRVQVAPHEIKLVPANVIIKTPPGFMLLIVLRSSTPLKKGLMLANSVGIIDQDYSGKRDEIKIQVYNFTDQKTTIQKGDRLAQGIFVKITKADWQEKDNISTNSRGGFGSTGE